MGINIAEALEATINLPISWREAVVNLEVYLERITPEALEEIAEAAEKSSADSMCRLIAKFTKGWDLHNNGAEFLPTFENLRKLPIKFLLSCANSILALWQGNPTSAENSRSFSAPAESQKPTA